MRKRVICLLLCAALLLGAAGCASKPVQTAPGLTYNELLAAFRQTAEVPLAQKLEYVNSENWRFIDGRVWAYGSSFATEEGDSQRLLASCLPDGGDAAFLPVKISLARMACAASIPMPFAQGMPSFSACSKSSVRTGL